MLITVTIKNKYKYYDERQALETMDSKRTGRHEASDLLPQYNNEI